MTGVCSLRLPHIFCSGVLLCACYALPAGAAKPPAPSNIVDSGSFVVIAAGQRVSVETFSIAQLPDGSITKSVINSVSGVKAEQRAELELAANGDLRRYEWHEVSPGKGHSLLLPEGDFLKQQYGATAEEHATQAYILLPSTTVLDNNFFVLRELALWRYLRDFCPASAGKVTCPAVPASGAPSGDPPRLPAVVPMHRYSMQVVISFLGREIVPLRGAPVELLRFNLDDDTGQWTLWVDDNYRLQRVRLDKDETEVIRE